MSVIKFERVTFQYSNSNVVLEDVTFEIKSNSTTILLGKNGSGKSTLLKLLMHFEKPQEGKIFLNNKCIDKYSILERSKEIAYVGQDVFNQFDFSVKDYLLFGVTNTLSMFQSPNKKHNLLVQKFVDKFEISHLLNKSMDKISGGEKQIVMICKTFIQGSNIIVLDEPLSALDFINQNRILKLLRDIKTEKKTIIFTTHNPNHALYLDANVLMIDQKKLVFDGKARDVLTIENLKSIYGDIIGFSSDHPYEEFSIKR